MCVAADHDRAWYVQYPRAPSRGGAISYVSEYLFAGATVSTPPPPKIISEIPLAAQPLAHRGHGAPDAVTFSHDGGAAAAAAARPPPPAPPSPLCFGSGYRQRSFKLWPCPGARPPGAAPADCAEPPNTQSQPSTTAPHASFRGQGTSPPAPPGWSKDHL